MRVSRMRSEHTPREYERKKRMRTWTRWPLGMVIFSFVGYFAWLWAWAFGYDPSGPVTVASNCTLCVPLVIGVFWPFSAVMCKRKFIEIR